MFPCFVCTKSYSIGIEVWRYIIFIAACTMWMKCVYISCIVSVTGAQGYVQTHVYFGHLLIIIVIILYYFIRRPCVFADVVVGGVYRMLYMHMCSVLSRWTMVWEVVLRDSFTDDGARGHSKETDCRARALTDRVIGLRSERRMDGCGDVGCVYVCVCV